MDNGLTVLLQQDKSTAMVAVCVLYKVGSRDEQADKTGIAHLFEHLMFSNCGPGIDFDEVLQNAGGECNAFTTTDTTQYYSIAPASQLELLLALESNRISGFHVTRKDFKTQQRVVIEEFSEIYLNNPYGEFTHHLMALAYKTHPYRWPVIGFNQNQLKELDISDAEHFYNTYYNPTNAVLVVNGNIDWEETKALIEKHFGKIKAGLSGIRFYPKESELNTKRSLTISKELPEEGFYFAFPYCGRMDPDFYAVDFMTDMLSEGKSSMLYKRLKKESLLCSTIDCYITATTDPGLIIVEAKLSQGRIIEEAEQEFWTIIQELKNHKIPDHTFEKYMNKNESAYLFSQLGVMNQALNLSYAEWLGNPNLVYTELDNYLSLTKDQIHAAANKYFMEDQFCSLYYRQNK
ncbi:MAG: insulinase family protein [Saprospiraceae bacterium]|nr:insulinase family protein [Saprospiraceae bacterium]